MSSPALSCLQVGGIFITSAASLPACQPATAPAIKHITAGQLLAATFCDSQSYQSIIKDQGRLVARHMMESLSTEPSLGWITTHGGSGGRTKCQTKCDDDGQILILMILTQITDPQGLSCSRFFWVVGYLLVYSSHPTMLVVGPLSCPVLGYLVGWREFSLPKYPVSPRLRK